MHAEGPQRVHGLLQAGRGDARRPSSTDGWLKTGDAGFFDKQGQLVIIDRAKDVGKLTDGSAFAPQFIENKLKFSPFIREAVAFGDQRPFVVAMIAIDMQTVGTWAEKQGLAYTSFMDLSRKPEVAGMIGEEIAKANATLPDVQQVKRYLLLNKELDADDAEMTRTRKVRRSFVAEKYAASSRHSTAAPRRSTSRWRSPSRTAASRRSSRPSRIHGNAAGEPAREGGVEHVGRSRNSSSPWC